MTISKLGFPVLALSMVLLGCASEGVKDTGNPGGSVVQGSGTNSTRPNPIPLPPRRVSPVPIEPATSTANIPSPIAPNSNVTEADLRKNVVYFNYDGADLSDAGLLVIANYARFLADSVAAKVRVEGHTDERGSTDYNVALGERRALAVARGLRAGGARENQITSTTYGEARPAVEGHDEAAYTRNRRVEIIR